MAYITEGTIKEIDAGLLSFRLEPSRGFKCETDGKTAIIFVQEDGKSPWVADVSTSNSAWSVPPESWFSFEDDKVLKDLEKQKQNKEREIENLQQEETEKLQQEIKDLQARLEILTQLKRQELLKSLSDLKNNGTTIRIRVQAPNLTASQSTSSPTVPTAILCDGLSIR